MPLTIRRRLVDRVRQWRKIAYTVCAGLVILAGGAVFLSILFSGLQRGTGFGSNILRLDRVTAQLRS
jgi:hypothetical protein